MSRKTHACKHRHPFNRFQRKLNAVTRRRDNWRKKLLAAAIALALLASGTFIRWQAKNDEVLIAKNIPSPARNQAIAAARSPD